MCKDAQFDLRVVGIKEYKTILRDKNLAQQPARLHADRDILQIRVGAADTPGCRDGLMESAVYPPILCNIWHQPIRIG